MRKSLLLFLALFMGLTMSFKSLGQERTVQGKVTSTEDGSPLPGVNVVIKGTTVGTITNADGDFRLSVSGEDATLIFSFVGYQNQEIAVGSQTVINVSMVLDVTQLSEVVVTALGVSRETKTLPYASQQVTAENLNISQDHDIKSALMGKVAGVQLNGQAGSKLGQFGKIRIRGAISLTADSDPLYVVDGVPTPDPNDVDMNNVESVNVLKGPNATALYGQRAQFGVVVITTKKAGSREGLSVDLQSSTTWDKLSYLPKYQNLYGGGYEGDASFSTFDYNNPPYADGPYPTAWSVLDGQRYITWDNNYADESWGPKFDDQPYLPWYAWWPDPNNPYYGQAQPYSAQPNNVKDFYDTGVTSKNTVSVSGSSNNFNARVSYSNVDQKGITPFTKYTKQYLLVNTGFDATPKLKITTNIRYTYSRTKGDFTDGYANQTSGSFNQWFNRQLETDRMKELRNITTIDGYSASWNWWGPEYYSYAEHTGREGFKKPAFWFNHYTYMEQYKRISLNENVVGNIAATYQIINDLKLTVSANRNVTEFHRDYEFPFYLANTAAPELYNSFSNSFGKWRQTQSENNYTADLRYNKKFENFDISALAGGTIRRDRFVRLNADMPIGAKTGGLLIPDLYLYSNAGIIPVTNFFESKKQVNSLYGNISLGYKGLAYLDASYRRDWSSALPSTSNGYGYPSIGASFIFSELMQGFTPLSFGKIRGGWAQVGSDVGALDITTTYPIGAQPFNGKILMTTPNQLVDPNITPALQNSFEAGFDTRWFNNRVGLSFTYYNETRKDDIIPITIPRGSGYNTYLTNTGETRRKGVEISLDADIIKSTSGLTWNMLVNFAKNNTTVESLPSGLDAINGVGGTGSFAFISVINELGNNWGQLRGTKIQRDDAGNPVLDPTSGLYVTVPDQYFGSILPDFQGGIVNRISFKGIQLAVNIDYQKGGKFFSLSEMWGSYSGLLAETAAINDNGMNVRDAVGDGGGVHVTGVDDTGAPVDMYADGLSYWKQWYSNRLAEPFVHDASYIKLREVVLTYDLTSFIKSGVIKGASIGIVGRNLALLAVSKDNKQHRWDPTTMSKNYGEDGQLPGIKSYGVNLQLTF